MALRERATGTVYRAYQHRSISEIVPLEDVAKGIEKLASHEGDPIRILVKP